jgi:hypothetical protein
VRHIGGSRWTRKDDLDRLGDAGTVIRTRLLLCDRCRGDRSAARYGAALAGLGSAMTRSEAALSVSGSEPVAIGSASDDDDF